MAYTTGVTKRLGRVEEGNTISDYDKEEQKRLFSISATVVPILWEETKINFIDTPGYFDFVGEVEEAVSAADAAVIVVSAKAGVEVGTQKAWDICERFKLPRMFFVTDMDDDNASYRNVVEDLKERYGNRIAPFHTPIRENEKFVGFVNVVKNAGRRFTNNLGEYVDGEIPEYCKEYSENYRAALMESIAESSEELMEKYFEGEEFTMVEIENAIRGSVGAGDMVPVLCGSGVQARGTFALLQAIDKYFPSPNKGVVTGMSQKTGTTFFADYDANKDFSARVWKTIADPFIGKFSLIKVCSGVLKSDSVIYNANKETEEKLSRLYILRGKEQIEVKELYAGDIGAIGKLSDTQTGDTLSTKANPIIYDPIKVSVPYTYVRYEAKNKGDDDKISQALSKIMEEDKTLAIVNDKENRQTLLYGIGDQQLEVTVSKILNRYKAEMVISKPKIAYRETIKKQVQVQGRHKKQSGGAGQFGDVIMIFEPSGDLDKPYVFEEKIFGGSVPKNFFPAIEKGIQESVLAGPLAGYPVVGIKATLIDGSYHPVDSSEMAFKTATSMAFKDGIPKAKPVILEPIATVSVLVNEEYMGDIMGDLTKRRGRVLGMEHLGGKVQLNAEVPMSEMSAYATDLRSMTQGRGSYTMEFARYEQTLPDVQAKIIAENKKDE
jgi:elongation factor G